MWEQVCLTYSSILSLQRHILSSGSEELKEREIERLLRYILKTEGEWGLQSSGAGRYTQACFPENISADLILAWTFDSSSQILEHGLTL